MRSWQCVPQNITDLGSNRLKTYRFAQVWERYYFTTVGPGTDLRAEILAMINVMQSVDFLKAQLLHKLSMSADTYRNKWLDGIGRSERT